jgi:Putative transposase DNA-binding domain
MATYWNALCDRLNEAWQAEVHVLGPEYESLCEHAKAVLSQLEQAGRNTDSSDRIGRHTLDRPAGEETRIDGLVREHRQTWRSVAALRRMRRTDAAIASQIKALWDGFERDIKTIGAWSGCHESNRAHVAGSFRLALRRLRHGAGRPQKKFIGGNNSLDPASINRVTIRHRFGGGGVPILRCFSDAGGLFHLDPVPDDAYASNARAARHRRLTTGHLRLRTGTAGESKSYLVIRFGVVLHRPLPQNGIAKLLQLSGRRSFGTWSWRLNITLEQPPRASASESDYRPIGGLDLNWRHIGQRPDIRFGAIVDSAGGCYFLTLPLAGQNTRRRFRDHAHLAELQKRADDLLRRTKVQLSAVLAQCDSLPEAVAAWAANLAEMGRRSFLMGLSLFEQYGVVPNAQTLLRSQWLVEDQRIRKRIARLSEHLVNRRTHLYRNIAVALCRRYRIIAIKGDFAVSRVIRTAQKSLSTVGWRNENDTSAFSKSGRYRQWAATGAFVRCLEEAARKHGTVIFKGTGAFLTVTHHSCGGIVPRARDIELYCDRCRVTFDQDLNAAHNLLSQIPQFSEAAGEIARPRPVDNPSDER